MNINIRFWSNCIVYLPMLVVLLFRNYLPAKVAVHFSATGGADQIAPQTLWLHSLLDLFIWLVIIRTVLLTILARQASIPDSQLRRTQLLSAIFVALILALRILEGLLARPVSTDYQPIVIAIFSAVCLYFLVPKSAAAVTSNPATAAPAKQVTFRQQLQSLSRLITVRVNLMAGVIMLFSRSSDRWTIGILANLLALVAVGLLAYWRLQESDR